MQRKQRQKRDQHDSKIGQTKFSHPIESGTSLVEVKNFRVVFNTMPLPETTAWGGPDQNMTVQLTSNIVWFQLQSQ